MKQYSKVRLITDRYTEEGANFGDLGYIIEVYADGNCEVEFSDGNTGITFAQLVVKPDELKIMD
ncbi:DUF4926 domain-containing protein [Heliobacterium chlorum]|uniref:DUF4926 domain-containing protein n=1 Tax=Heliobacterium chlorum TaxID=2698 RepID=A0ABR7T618_HELCL|nr:DUF4926 domain-containing protein [Heliobacterium chlorum]MBC9786215.1 DUF4926 domain-containing protein [Heliobacterium chlorum]